MPRLNQQKLIKACFMSFQGTPDKEIISELEIHTSTLSYWRRHSLWEEIYKKLVEDFIEEEKKKLFENRKTEA